jgi:hypothetical protein
LFSCLSRLCGCTGCGREAYWSEWHNDPPRCCDPCDRCGNWVGPSYGYRAPYDHSYYAGGGSSYYVGQKPGYSSAGATTVANRSVPRPKATTTRPLARKPQQGTKQTYQR